jgi:hypothetical protein
MARITSALRVASDTLAETVKKRPITALGVAAGAGFVLGSAFGSRLGRLALMAAAGYAAQEVVEGALGEGGITKWLSDELSRLAARADASAHRSDAT